jgi:cysteinyl-tRNA synthetase
MSEDRLTRDDLVLLMESYRNMITMHQTILDQTSKTISIMENIVVKQDSTLSKQSQVCNSLQNITGNLSTISVNLSKTADKIDSFETDITNQFNTHNIRTIEDHGKLTQKIYLGWIGMGTIIIGLVSLIYTITKI